MKRFNPYRFMRIGDHVVENIYEPEYFEDEEIEELEEIQVRVPNTMSNEDVEKMLINHVPELHKYYYNTHQDEDE